MDRSGRKRIQMIGFAVMAATFIAIALLGDATSVLVPFVVLYAVNDFFTEFGPNTTTFIYLAEIFPVRIRTTSHGIAATIGKVGAAVGTFTFRCCNRPASCPARCGSRAALRSSAC